MWPPQGVIRASTGDNALGFLLVDHSRIDANSESEEFKASLGYIARACLKKQKEKTEAYWVLDHLGSHSKSVSKDTTVICRLPAPFCWLSSELQLSAMLPFRIPQISKPIKSIWPAWWYASIILAFKRLKSSRWAWATNVKPCLKTWIITLGGWFGGFETGIFCVALAVLELAL